MGPVSFQKKTPCVSLIEVFDFNGLVTGEEGRPVVLVFTHF